MKKVKIKARVPNMAYPGSTVQQNYAEDLVHGYLHWSIEARDKYNVQFRQLPNPRPYVTVEWAGGVAETIAIAVKHPKQSRFRIKSNVYIPEQDVRAITNELKHTMQATEVTFKVDHHVDRANFTAGSETLAKTDLRNPDALLRLIKACYVNAEYTDDEWQRVHDQVKVYLSDVAVVDGGVLRNAKWSLRHLSFDNLFSYGSGNAINFDNLNGIVGIFGANRVGKSSIVGTMMYSLFNTTDRGPVKNLYVCNIREPYCYSKAIINVDGSDYVIERQTTKHENRRGERHATTALNVFKINENMEAVDLAGEQRLDTEKVIRNLIGSPDDFLLTSLSAQGDTNNQFISHGSARRRQILSRFLDLDIFDKMYDIANTDVKLTKAQLRAFPEKDWNSLAADYKLKLTDLSREIDECTQKSHDARERLDDLRARLLQHKDFTPVTKSQVEMQRSRVETLEKQANDYVVRVNFLEEEIKKINAKITTVDVLVKENDVNELKRKLEAFVELESSVASLKHVHDKESTTFKQQERSLKILDEVPCDDKFPTCKFIKDAHVNKGKIDSQREKVNKALERLSKATVSLDAVKEENLKDRVAKVQQLVEMLAKLKLEASNKQIELMKLQTSLDVVVAGLEPAKSRLDELEEALKNDENAEVVSIRSQIDELMRLIKGLDDTKLSAAAQRGRIISDAEKSLSEKKSRDSLLAKMKVYEIIAHSFSRRGIPHTIVSSQLPLINVEISKILAGIVDFTIELESEEDSDNMDVFINYGDSRRIVELCSGMEKMIASLSIRVALINVSSLPKTDMFIVDEGFGALDDAGVESCNRLLTSLKRYFKSVIVITHVDGVKDAADIVLEITKNEKNTRVVYE